MFLSFNSFEYFKTLHFSTTKTTTAINNEHIMMLSENVRFRFGRLRSTINNKAEKLLCNMREKQGECERTKEHFFGVNETNLQTIYKIESVAK